MSSQSYRDRPFWRRVLYVYETAWRYRSLIKELALDDLKRTYRNTLLGIFWLLVHPLLFAGSFVFVRYILMGRGSADWSAPSTLSPSLLLTATAIFIGFIVYWIASECLARSTVLIKQNSSILTEMAFPAEVFPWVTLVSALFSAAIRLALLAFPLLWLHGGVPPAEALLLPVILIPLVLVTLGATFLLSALAPFLRDIEIIVTTLLGSLLILSGVIFSVADLPEQLGRWLLLNPITLAIEQSRHALLFGQLYGGAYWLGMVVFGLALMALGSFVFMRLRGKFADVL